MKTHKYLYQKMLDETIIRQAYANLRKGKTKRTEIKYIDNHLGSEVQKMKLMIENTKPCEVEYPELAFKPIYHKPKIIKEHGKERTIYVPEIHEQWLHHIIIVVLKPIIISTAHPNVCGSFPNRGAHYGKRKIERWIQSKAFKRFIDYFAKIDICHFYNSISHKVLFRELRNRIQDEWFLYIISRCLSQFKKGLPLGFYISQWLANYLLEPIDKMVSVKFPNYIRYMDDIVFFGFHKSKIKNMVNSISRMLGYRFYLRLKNNYQVALFDEVNFGRPLDFMGFVFYRNKTIIRKSIMISATRLAKKIYKLQEKGYRVRRKMISGFLSYMGWFKHTNSYSCYLKYIKPYVHIGLLKRIISSMDRRVHKKNDRMERNKIFRASKTGNKSRTRAVYAG